MVTKDELSEKLNELLDLELEIDFTKLNKDDLEQFWEFMSHSPNLISLGVKTLRGAVRRDLLEKPLKELLDVPENEEKGGPLGFGLLPRAQARIRGLREKG